MTTRLAVVLITAIGLTSTNIAVADTLTFQQGDGGAYSETAATRVTLGETVNFGSGDVLTLFTFDPDVAVISLVGFPLIIGGNAGQIPANSLISSAALELTRVIDDSAVANLHQVYTAWDENTVTGASWGDVAGSDYGPVAGSFPYGTAGTVASIDITTIVQAWASGTANQGVMVRPEPGTFREARYHSDDAVVATTRPKLTVEFTPPEVAVEPTTWGRIKSLYR